MAFLVYSILYGILYGNQRKQTLILFKSTKQCPTSSGKQIASIARDLIVPANPQEKPASNKPTYSNKKKPPKQERWKNKPCPAKREYKNKFNEVSLMANLAWWNACSEGLRESPCRSSRVSLFPRTRNNWKSLSAFPNERTLTIPMELGLLDFLNRSSTVNRRFSGSCVSPSPSQSEASRSFPFMKSQQPRALRRSCLDRLTSDTNHPNKQKAMKT